MSEQFKLKVVENTFFKRSPAQSSSLPPSDLSVQKPEAEYELHSYATHDEKGDFDGHVKFALKSANIGGFNTWYAFGRHIEVYLGDRLVYPLEEQAAKRDESDTAPISDAPDYKGQKLTLPGGRIVHTDQPIIANGSFTWGEATHDGVRIPQSAQHVQNIVNLATHLQRARNQIGKPFTVTSWYRPEPWNSRVGGARRSQHLEGPGVDIVVDGYLGRELGRAVMPWWPGGLGIYPGNRVHILHLDIGPKRNWGF